jgi:hypothetical protein
VDPKGRNLILESGKRVPYDIISFNVGSYVPDSITMGTAKIEKMLKFF